MKIYIRKKELEGLARNSDEVPCQISVYKKPGPGRVLFHSDNSVKLIKRHAEQHGRKATSEKVHSVIWEAMDKLREIVGTDPDELDEE